MKAELTIIRIGESWGATGSVTHVQDSTLAAHTNQGYVTLTLKQGAVNAPAGADPVRSTPEVSARMRLTLEEAQALGRFLLNLREDD